MIPIDCPVQTYAWGKKGSASAVAQLKSAQAGGSFTVDESKSYAELWMGTHPSGPARIFASQMLLSDFLSSSPHLVGHVPAGYASHDLPFLFKVLSIETALSIQSHPDKALAARLHQADPANYKDANHKPEMVIALSDFHCLCGFRPLSDLRTLLPQFPEYLQLLQQRGYTDVLSDVQGEGGRDEAEVLRRVFDVTMHAPAEVVGPVLAALVQRLNNTSSSSVSSGPARLVLRLAEQYPGDVGVLAALLLNELTLRRGESFFISANQPHAYLHGDCVECMALSDNVVRAGLTPKFRDLDTLCQSLTFRPGPPLALVPRTVDAATAVYRPPVEACAECEVERILLSSSPKEEGREVAGQVVVLRPLPCASLLVLVDGGAGDEEVQAVVENERGGWERTLQRCTLRRGNTLFLAADAQVSLSLSSTSSTSSGEPLTFFRAHVNLADWTEDAPAV